MPHGAGPLPAAPLFRVGIVLGCVTHAAAASATCSKNTAGCSSLRRVQRYAWIVGIWLIAVSHARGQTPLPLELAWHAPAECPTAAQAREELARVARIQPGYNLTQLSARVEIEHHADAYMMRLHTTHEGQEGERRLEAANCKTLVRTLTLVLALAFGTGVQVSTEAAGNDSLANATEGDATNTPPASTADDQPKPDAKQPPPKQRSDRARDAPTKPPALESTGAARSAARGGVDDTSPPHLTLLAGGGVQLGLLPSAAFSAGAGIELDTDAWSLALRASAWPGVSRSVSSDARADFDGFAGELQACGRLPLATIVLGLCAGARAAALRGQASGVGMLQPDSATAPWYALAGSAALTWPRSNWLALRLEASLAASLDRPRFVIVGFGRVHRVAQLVPDTALQLLVTL
jgi:hypothetical protein